MDLKKIVLIGLGCIGLAFGAIGAVVPLIPAFPFLMIAAVCFGKSSQRLSHWFTATKLYKDNLESFVQGRGMTRKAKLRIITIVTVTMAIGFVLMHNVPIGRIILIIVWVLHLLYFTWKVKTIQQSKGLNVFPAE